MIHLLTYSNRVYEPSRRRLCLEARLCGWFDTVTALTPEDLSPGFRAKFKTTLRMARIAGFGIWRPEILANRLAAVAEDDFVIYLDAGCTINPFGYGRFREYLDLVARHEEGIISFQLPRCLERQWTTYNIFKYFDTHPDSAVGNSGQFLDGILVMQNTPRVRSLVARWLATVHDAVGLFTDQYNLKYQHEGFRDNRHEQSVFSIIRKLGNPLVVPDETFFDTFGSTASLAYPFWATRLRRVHFPFRGSRANSSLWVLVFLAASSTFLSGVLCGCSVDDEHGERTGDAQHAITGSEDTDDAR